MAILTPDQHGPHDVRQIADVMFHERAMQYYVGARFAAKAGLIPVTGNLYHHAVEMLLKSHLLFRRVSLYRLEKEFRHDLKKLWKEFKGFFPNENLHALDKVVLDLNRFKDIRYPGNNVFKGGDDGHNQLGGRARAVEGQKAPCSTVCDRRSGFGQTLCETHAAHLKPTGTDERFAPQQDSPPNVALQKRGTEILDWWDEKLSSSS